MKFHRFFNVSIILLLILPSVSSSQQADVPDIGSRLELFVDHYLIDHMKNTRLVMHHPHDEGQVLAFDKPWEGAFCGYGTIIKDGDIYRLYYRGLPRVGDGYPKLETTCYAESKDGIHWTKPELGIYEINGSKLNNVILTHEGRASHNFAPFLDTRPDVEPTQRYKAFAGTGKTGLLAFVSADGIHWRKLQDEPVFTKGKFDSQNVGFWSEAEQCYLCYFRTWTGDEYKGFRTVSRTTSKDFVNWTEPEHMDFGDTPMEHLYTNQTHPYFRAPHIYLSTAARFMPNRQVLTDEQAKALQVDPKYFKDCSDAIFMTSRGGNQYDRTFMESFIAAGIGLQNWVSRSNYPLLNVVPTGPAEMSVYVNQNYAQPTANIHRYSLRTDGFASVNAPYQGGEMVTKVFRFDGSRLVINFSTSAAGEILVEIQDKDGKAISGFSEKDCRATIGNEIERVVAWESGSDVSKLAGTSIRLRFVMKDAHLYSMRFK